MGFSIKNFPANRVDVGGQSLIELLVTIGLASILLPALLTGLLASREGRAQQEQRLIAMSLLKEGEEVARSVREKDWNEFSLNGTYHPVVSGTSWSLAIGAETIMGYTRQILVEDVNRDAGGTIVTSGGSPDPSTKKVTVSVSWGTPIPSSVSSTLYLTRYKSVNYKETTESDFNAGTKTGVVVTNTDGGEVVLGAGGSGDWCSPNLTISAVDLPKNGVANAISAIPGQVVAGTGDNASGVSFANVAISNPPAPTPPQGTIDGTFDGYKTNGVFTEQNYAYLATDTNSKEIVIIDLTQKDSNNKYEESGYFNAPGNGSGDSIYVSGNIGFMTSANKLYTFDLSSKASSRSQLGSISLAGEGNRVVVVGSYAYIAVESSTTQLQIVQIQNGGATLSIVGQAALAAQAAKDVFINSSATRAYIASSLAATQAEFFIVDISTKTGNRPTLGSYDTNGMNPKAVIVTTNNKSIVVGTGGQEYQVINISTESNPSSCGGLDIDAGVNGVSTVIEPDGDAFSYIITGDATAELKIIEGGPGGQFADSGIFISDAFDPGSTVAYNRLVPNSVQPNQTTIQFQAAVANAVSGSCTNASYYFVGPDGTSNTFFTTSSAIPLLNNGQGYVNPGRCFKYKAYLSTSDPVFSPVFNDISVNYSP